MLRDSCLYAGLLVFALIWFIDANAGFTYEKVSAYLSVSRMEWYAAVLLGVLALVFITDAFLRRYSRGRVTTDGFVWDVNNCTVSHDDVRIIQMQTGTQSPLAPGTFWVTLLTSRGKQDICLSHREVVALSWTRWTKWTLEGGYEGVSSELTISAGESGNPVEVPYPSMGKYEQATPYGGLFLVCMFSGSSFFQLFHLPFNLLYLFIFGVIFLWVTTEYRKMEVAVREGGVLLRQANSEEKFFSFTDVLKVEKGLFRVKVTTISGEVHYFPKACVFLDEIIQEHANLGN